MARVACPFCKPKQDSIHGEGCCNCEYLGTVPIGENVEFKTIAEALTHDPEISYYDLRLNRTAGRDLNYKPF